MRLKTYTDPRATARQAAKQHYYKLNKRRINENSKVYRSKPRSKLLRYFYHIKNKYELSPEGFYGMVQEQRGLCENPRCLRRLDDRTKDTRLNIDHDHETQVIRRLLCAPCNKALGLMKDDSERILGLVDLLNKESYK